MVARSRVALPLGHRWLRELAAAAASLGAVALVTGAIFALKPVAPVLSLGVLYLFAVLPVAAFWGVRFALLVSIVSMLAFNWLFLPPTHTFRLTDSENWVALAVYLVTAFSVGGLAARARRRAAEAEQRQREAALAAEVSAMLLESRNVQPQLPTIASRVARLFGASGARIELGPHERLGFDPSAYDLSAGERHVGRRFLERDVEPDGAVAARVAAILASLLATALDREQLAHDARESEARRRSDAIEAEALRRSDAAKTAVMRSVSHDLRSPITAAITAAEVLQESRDTLSAEERAELLGSIRFQLRRLERLVANLLDLSRLEAGAARPVPELWTVDSLVARALEAIGAENDRISVALPPESPAVQVDPTQLEHVLVNLLENALKFSDPSEPIEVLAEQIDDAVVVQVIDHGAGIPEHEQTRIFEPFSRGANGDGERGAGLGLAIARGFVQVNGDRLWVESNAGGGSIFALTLPVADVPAVGSA